MGAGGGKNKMNSRKTIGIISTLLTAFIILAIVALAAAGAVGAIKLFLHALAW